MHAMTIKNVAMNADASFALVRICCGCNVAITFAPSMFAKPLAVSLRIGPL
jgi:hypothetical protein